MASAYSTLHNYASLPVYTPDLTLVLEGLKYKQGKYDENREKLQGALDKYSMLDVVKNEDEKYLVDRLEKIEQITNRYTHMDLSSDALTQSLIRNMGQVVDDNVKNAVLSSKIYRGEQAAWKKLQEDEPDKYARQNYEFAQQRAQSWLADGEVGKKYNGGGGVIEFVDVNQTIKDGMKDLKDVYGLEMVELESGAKGTLFRDVVTREIATPTKVRQALESLLGPKEMQQLQIDAWAQFKDAPEDAVVNMARERQNFKIDSYATQVSKLESVLTNDSLTPEQKVDYQNQLESAKLNLQNAKEKPLGGLDVSNKETAYTSLYINDYLDGLTDLYSYNVVTDIKVYDNDKETYNAKIKLEELAIKKDKAASTSKKGKAGTTDEVTAFTSQNVLLDTEAGGEPKDAIQQVEDIANQSILNVEAVVGELNEDNYAEFNKVFSSENLSKKAGENVIFNGKTITLTPENIAKITSAQAALSGRQNNIFNETNNSFIGKIGDNLAQLTSAYYTEGASVDMDPTELIMPNFRIAVDANGNYQRVDVTQRALGTDIKDGRLYYLPLLKKYGDNIVNKGKTAAWESLTEEEQINLKMLSASMTIYDQETSETVAKTVDHTLKTDILKKVPAEITQSISNDLKLIRSRNVGTEESSSNARIKNITPAKISTFQEFGLSIPGIRSSGRGFYNQYILPDLQEQLDELSAIEKEFSGAPQGSQRKGELDAQMRNKIQDINLYVQSKSGSASGLAREEAMFEDNYLSELTDGDTEYTLPGADEVSLESTRNFIVGDWDKQLTEKAKSSVGDLSNLISVTGLKLTKEDPSYDMLVNQAKDPDGEPFVPSNYSDLIQISPVISEGAATGQYKLQAILTDKQKEEGYSGEAILTEQQLDQAKLSLPVNLEVTNYNTSLGDGAAKINLGTGLDNYYSSSISRTNENILKNNLENLKKRASGIDKGSDYLASVVQDYNSGNLRFGVEAIDVNGSGNYQYYGVMHKQGQIIPISPLLNQDNGQPVKMLNSSQVADYISNSKTYSTVLLVDFIEKELDELEFIDINQKLNNQ
jgi:hypothetical protein